MESFLTEEAAKRAAKAARVKLPGRINVETGLERYEQFLVRKGNRRKSIDETIRRMRNWHDTTMPLADVTEAQLKKRYERRCQEVAVDTHRNELSEVKTFWRWCAKEGFVRRSPAERIEPIGKRRKGKPQLRMNETQTLFDKALSLAEGGDEGAVAVMTVIFLGLRSSEVHCRKVRDVDNSEDKVFLWIDTGKTDAAARHMEVPEPVATFLLLQTEGKNEEDWLFPSPNSDSGHRSRTWMLRTTKRICKAAGVPRVCVHGLRGGWATLTADAGVSGHVIARELGHTDYKTTKKHYTRKGTIERVKVRRMLRVVKGGKVSDESSREEKSGGENR